MADRGDTHYHVRKLNLWFTLSSLLLLVSALWMVLDDWSRGWKRYQREFRQIEITRAREQLGTPEAQSVLTEEARLKEELAQSEASLASRRSDLDAAEKELRELQNKSFIATEAEKKAKQEYNWERWVVEEYRLHHGEPTAKQEHLKSFEDELATRAGVKQEADAAVLAQQGKIDALRKGVADVEAQLKASTKGIDLTRKKLASIAPEDAPTKVANLIRDFPGLDFIGPSLKVAKVIPPGLTFELNFLKKRRIDMCQTCHAPIDREGFDGEQQPFRSHPRLDLYLSAKSPHPLSQMGCSICHRGAGEALDFQRVDHRASDAAEAERWHDEHGWHKQHYWDYPMLSSSYVEASCVQCHKTSMELIAEDAPVVSEGYQLFERYACYACHKVDWFPTKRRPGPTLAKILQKTDKAFVDSWVAKPKSFRPTTWMPQIFHLENYASDVTISVSQYGQGREMKGDEWSDAAIAAVTAFVTERSAKEPLPEIPVEGDAARGREVFRVSGCLACHNMAPYTEEARAAEEDPANKLRETNEHGPNLRGVASKVTPEWLYAWIKDPSSYWSDTRMPNLRLSDQDAADIVAYFVEDPDGIFHDVPAGWEPKEVTYERDVLEEQARWFFNRTLRSELERLFREDWKDDRVLLQEVGKKWVLNQGCHSCHEIPGLENEQAIGTELTNWASKTVDKLDFGFVPEILAEQHGWSHEQEVQFKEYRENFLEQKLKEPRSYDRRKVKNPTERLRMPWFDLDEEEVRAITCFVAGLIDDEVQRAKMIPSAEELAMDTGLRVIRQKNCAACHVLEPGTIDFTDEDGAAHSVHGQFFVFDEAALPPPLEGFQEYVADYEADVGELDEVAIQLLRPEPGLGPAGSSVVVEDIDGIETRPAKGGGFVDVITDYYLFSDDVEDVDGERRPYAEEPYEKVRWTFAPPVLIDEGAKLQREWFYQFLLDPVTLRPQIRVRMPTFHWHEGEAAAVADYFANRSKRDWPSRYARKLLLELGKTPADVAVEMEKLVQEKALDKKITAAVIQGIVDEKPVETATGLDVLMAYGRHAGFAMDGPVDPAYEAVPQRSPSRMDPLLASQPDLFERVHTMVVEGPNCVQCHFLRGAPATQVTPLAWAPDLDLTRERLRPDWVREWLTDPARLYPGTSMPANFSADPPQWQEFYPAPGKEQIEAVLTWLYNLDRAEVRN